MENCKAELSNAVDGQSPPLVSLFGMKTRDGLWDPNMT